jgi:hypothetical protein
MQQIIADIDHYTKLIALVAPASLSRHATAVIYAPPVDEPEEKPHF